jgi:hypothetical protein
MQCADVVYVAGPEDAVSRYETTTFDADAMATTVAGFYGWDEVNTRRCARAITEANARYLRAADAGWPPYGHRWAWLDHWDSFTTCADILIGKDIKGWRKYRDPDVGAHSFVEGMRAKYLPSSYAGCKAGIEAVLNAPSTN